MSFKRYGELNAVRRVAGETCLGLSVDRSEADLEVLSEADPVFSTGNRIFAYTFYCRPSSPVMPRCFNSMNFEMRL